MQSSVGRRWPQEVVAVDSIQTNVTGGKAGSPSASKTRPAIRGPLLPPDIALAYRVNDAAKVSGLSRSSLYNLIGEGKLRSVVVAGRRLIPADALRDLIKGAAA
jgi:excisionase family DNA binding protein